MIATTYEKALELNLDPQVYGTFAEIGAGQETGNCFFRASGAAGLVAKTISAYDMTMSDAIYGKAPRYVSRERLGLMLDHEYQLLIERLATQRGERTTFFAFADTVSARAAKHAADLAAVARSGGRAAAVFVRRAGDAGHVGDADAAVDQIGGAGLAALHACVAGVG